MAKNKPLVITAGQVEQLQPGDRLDLSNSATKINSTGSTLNKCTPVYVTGNNATPAQADAQATTRVAGLVAETTVNGDPVEVFTDGVFVATTGEWDAVTGQTGGLTVGADYWLSEATAGRLTTTAPDADGDFVARTGHALSPTELDVEIAQPIKL
jgi:hypothetical protein